MRGGWIKIWRQLLDSEIWTACPAVWVRVWLAILLTVKYEPTDDMPSGSRVISLREFSLFCRVSMSELRSALTYLEDHTMITRKIAHRRTIVTVLNWVGYQDDERPARTVARTNITRGSHGDRTIAPDYIKVEEKEEDQEVEPSAKPADACPTGEWALTPPGPRPRPKAKKRRAVQAYSHEFLEFWGIYPWKCGKIAAVLAYASHSEAVGHSVIMAALEQQLPELQKQRVGFRLHPTTWLNEGRYLNEAADTKTPLERHMDSI